ncbi:MAG: DUF2330 domain-containing protein [Acidobacteriota bacterium]
MTLSLLARVVLGALLLLIASPASAFCGFYVARADTDLFNQASKVVMVRDGNRTVLTMANDYRGAADEFALVIPVPTVLERDQIHVTEAALIDHLDAYTAPRLVEYFDENPCQVDLRRRSIRPVSEALSIEERADSPRRQELGVTIEARYTVGEYDILILSAKESRGLMTWLDENDYRLPSGARRVLDSYIKQGLKFFVARVDLAARARLGYAYLRPLQVAYESPRFMLPIRLGTVNANGPQELFVFALTRTGRVETTNYRTVALPTDVEIPTFVKTDFASFYQALFDRQVTANKMKTVFLEYAWDMAWCDPCAADPLSNAQLRELGVFWLPEQTHTRRSATPQDVFVTRLHLRYTGETFPDDLRFHETGNRSNVQGRYVLRHPWTGPGECAAAYDYHRRLEQRRLEEAKTLAWLTNWPLDDIHQRMGTVPSTTDDRPWWKKIWGRR